jgi:hypothetical protein
MSDADIAANEKFFQETKALSTNAPAAPLKVNCFVWSLVDMIIDALQVYFHVVTRDTTVAGGNVSCVSRPGVPIKSG